MLVDDFHRLDDVIKASLSDRMKFLADYETEGSKLILIGINKAGQQLVKFAHDQTRRCSGITIPNRFGMSQISRTLRSGRKPARKYVDIARG